MSHLDFREGIQELITSDKFGTTMLPRVQKVILLAECREIDWFRRQQSVSIPIKRKPFDVQYLLSAEICA